MEYHDFIKAAEKTNMSDKEYVLYSESEQKEADIRRGIAWAEQQAEERGIEKGIAKGKLSEALEIAKRLLSMKMDLKSISQACGIDMSQLEQLAAGM